MDNNPFRNHQPQTGSNNDLFGQQPSYNSNGYSSLGGGYQQQPQQSYQQQQPQQYQQPQQSWQYQQPTNALSPQPTTPYSSTLSQPSTFTSPLVAQQTSAVPATPYSPYTANSSLMSSTNNVNTPPQMNNFGNTYQPYGTTQMPSLNANYPTTPINPNTNNNMMYNTNGGLGGYPQQQQQQPYNSQSNFYIPPNFGQSTTNNNSFQPRHAPVDASSLLKGTQVRRVECPVCQKMIEGDDMAVNHHVNEHYS